MNRRGTIAIAMHRCGARALFALLVVVPAGLAGTLAAPMAVQASGAASTPWPGGHWQPDPVRYGMTVVHNIPLKMNDGVTLIANVGYPTNLSTGARASGKFPVLLTQDPYPAEDEPNAFYVTRGYIHAVVQVRGTVDTYGPGGKEVVSPFFGPRQTEDSVALVNWAAHKLSGSNGVIGLDGCSFLGIDQIFTAAAVGPNSPIKEILPACASNDYNNYFAGGIPSQIAGLFDSSLSETLEGTRDARVNHAEDVELEHQFVTGGPTAYNNKFWQERTTYNVIPNIVKNHIPALLWSGWYPVDGPGSLLEYAEFQNTYEGRPTFAPMVPGQKVTGRYQVVIGPWQHGQGLDESMQLEWYDTWLKNEPTGMTSTKTPMHLYALQANQWVNASTYPLSDQYTALHLGTDGSLTTSTAETGTASIAWTQPTDPNGVLTFNTQPFKQAELVGGPIAATIYAKSNNTNLELNATLNDVSPSGQVTQIATGTILGALRAVDKSRSWYDRNGLMVFPYHPYSKNQYAPAGSLQRYDIELTPSLYEVAPGHHLQLVLTTQPPADKCASLLSALTTPLPCLPSTPQRKTLPGGVYQIAWGTSTPSSVNVPLLQPGAVHATTSSTTPTSENQTEPLDWSGP